MQIEVFFSEDEYHVPAPSERRKANRLFVTGNPLLLDRPTFFPKPNWLIDLGSGADKLTLSARRLLNLLVALCWNHLEDSAPDFVFGAYATDLRRAIGQTKARDNLQFKATINLLAATTLGFPSLRAQDGTCEGAPECRILEKLSFSDNGEIVTWRINRDLRDVLAQQTPWAWLELGRTNKLTSKYALALYERAALLSRRKFPKITVTPDELRRHLGAGDLYPTWYALETRALNPALEQVEKHTGLKIKTTTTVSRRRKTVSKVQMVVSGRVGSPGKKGGRG